MSERKTVLDGGWGWFVVLASFIVHFIADGIVYTYGVIVPHLVDHFETGRAVVGGVGSLTIGIMWVAGPLASVIVNFFNFRIATVAGALVSAAGFVISSFSSSILLLYFSNGILAGLGLSCVYLSSVVVISRYFERRRALATGISYCGVGFGTMLLPPFAAFFLNVYGWRGTLLIEAALLLNCCVCGMTFVVPPALSARVSAREKSSADKKSELEDASDEVGANSPLQTVESSNCQSVPEKSHCRNLISADTCNYNVPGVYVATDNAADSSQHSSVEGTDSRQSFTVAVKEKSASKSLVKTNSQNSVPADIAKAVYFDYMLLRDPVLITYAISNLLTCLSLSAIFIFLPDLSQIQAGLSSYEMSLLFLILGITNTLARVVIGSVADQPWLNAVFTYGVIAVLLGTASVFVPFYNNFALFAAYSAVSGISMGSITCLLPVVLTSLFGVDRLTDSFGAILCCCGVGTAIGAPIVGALYDYQQSYDHSYVFAGLVLIVSGLMVFFLPSLQQRRKARALNS